MGGTRVIDAHVADGAGACLDVAKALSRTPTGSDASRYTSAIIPENPWVEWSGPVAGLDDNPGG